MIHDCAHYKFSSSSSYYYYSFVTFSGEQYKLQFVAHFVKLLIMALLKVTVLLTDFDGCSVHLQLRNSKGSLIIPKGSIEVNTSTTLVSVEHLTEICVRDSLSVVQ